MAEVLVLHVTFQKDFLEDRCLLYRWFVADVTAAMQVGKNKSLSLR